MAIDWDAELLGPVMAVFGEGDNSDPSSIPLYYPTIGTPFRLSGAVFDEQYQRSVALDADVVESTAHPVLGVRAALFATPPVQGDTVFIPSTGKTFRVVNPEPDGHGHILLILMETEL